MKFKIRLILPYILTGLISLTFASGCKGGKPNHDKITLTGSSTIAPLAAEIARMFEKKHPGVRVDVQTGGSSRGIADARRGLADIGMVSRNLKKEENDLKGYRIALDGVAIILHRDNPVKNMSEQQIVAIYTGKIKNWSEVGRPSQKITVVNKAEGRSTLELFLHHFKIKSDEIRADIIIGDNQQGILTVASDPFAIGYVSIGTAEYEFNRGTSIRLLPMNGVLPSLENVKNGKFPLSRPLHFVTKGEIKPSVKAFLDFAMSSEVNDLVETQFFVPIAR